MLEGERRLSAVMLTDLVGYTALTQRNEAKALEALEQHRTLVRPLLDGHKGREVKTIGDAFLVEFGNALDATRCAIAIQKALHERPTGPDGSPVQLRIGLHVGDVVHQAGDIYGDAVNLVSRVEPLAEPGGICVSGAIYEQVRNKIELPFVALGETSLKNVAYPVPLYRIELPWTTRSPTHLTHGSLARPRRRCWAPRSRRPRRDMEPPSSLWAPRASERPDWRRRRSNAQNGPDTACSGVARSRVRSHPRTHTGQR